MSLITRDFRSTLSYDLDTLSKSPVVLKRIDGIQNYPNKAFIKSFENCKTAIPSSCPKHNTYAIRSFQQLEIPSCKHFLVGLQSGCLTEFLHTFGISIKRATIVCQSAHPHSALGPWSRGNGHALRKAAWESSNLDVLSGSGISQSTFS